ncbi:MAG: DUF4325 domain-containing protein [Patescibacteria group bacterium]|jgi:hypothetical protein
MKNVFIKDFTISPGGRFKQKSDFSGEEFREKFLEPLFQTKSNEIINVYLDGLAGYPTSFFEEAFGGLVRVIKDKNAVQNRINLITTNSILKREIESYIENA